MTYLLVYLAIVLTLSLATFITYGLDKKWAGLGRRRVPEKTLHVLGFLGGWPGAYYAQRRFRHKTRKTPFLLVFWALVLLHVTLVGSVIYLVAGSSESEVGDTPRSMNRE